MPGNLVKIRQYLQNWLTFQALPELVILKTLKVNKVAKIIGIFSQLIFPGEICQILHRLDINTKQK